MIRLFYGWAEDWLTRQAAQAAGRRFTWADEFFKE